MGQTFTVPILAGLLTSGLFFVVFALGLGFIFLFIPTLPLFFIGLGQKHHQHMRLTLGTACTAIAVITGLPMMLLFLLFMGGPAWYISKKSLLWRMAPTSPTGQAPQQEWFPLGTIILHLTLYSCAVIAFITAYYVSQDLSLPQLLSKNIHESFADLQGDYGDIIDMLAGELSFLMFPVTMWLWAMILYSHAWLVNRKLVNRKENLRPDYRVGVFTIPSWMLSLLAISALASMIGSESMSFLGKTTLLCLMLPYFFQGSALLHAHCKNLPSRRFFLFFVYFMVFSQFWPALIIAAIGLWHQVTHLRAPPQK